MELIAKPKFQNTYKKNMSLDR